MTTDFTREEFSVLEREVEGEKLVTRHILEQTRRNSDDLAAIKSRLDRVERKVDGLEQKVEGLDRKIDGVDVKVSRLARELPIVVGDVMRQVLRERGGES
jgi:uncharacterized protein YoxC